MKLNVSTVADYTLKSLSEVGMNGNLCTRVIYLWFTAFYLLHWLFNYYSIFHDLFKVNQTSVFLESAFF